MSKNNTTKTVYLWRDTNGADHLSEESESSYPAIVRDKGVIEEKKTVIAAFLVAMDGLVLAQWHKPVEFVSTYAPRIGKEEVERLRNGDWNAHELPPVPSADKPKRKRRTKAEIEAERDEFPPTKPWVETDPGIFAKPSAKLLTPLEEQISEDSRNYAPSQSNATLARLRKEAGVSEYGANN
jgi:hypothetical protein